MSLIEIVYASAPADQVIINTLEIKHPSIDPIRICADYADHTVTLEDDTEVTFLQSGFDISLPNKDTSGNQALRFAIDNVTGIAQAAIDTALNAGGPIAVIYRAYLLSDLSAPAAPPVSMVLVAATFESSAVQIEASYFDLLNTAWPRKRYTATFAPGIKYFAR